MKFMSLDGITMAGDFHWACELRCRLFSPSGAFHHALGALPGEILKLS